MLLCPPQIAPDLTWDETQTTMVPELSPCISVYNFTNFLWITDIVSTMKCTSLVLIADIWVLSSIPESLVCFSFKHNYPLWYYAILVPYHHYRDLLYTALCNLFGYFVVFILLHSFQLL